MSNSKLSKQENKKAFFEYKGKPLVRCGNVIYYGDMNDKYVVKIESKNTQKISELDVSNNLSVAMLDTATEDSNSQKVLKTSEKKGLYAAIDIAKAWLDRALAE